MIHLPTARVDLTVSISKIRSMRGTVRMTFFTSNHTHDFYQLYLSPLPYCIFLILKSFIVNSVMVTSSPMHI